MNQLRGFGPAGIAAVVVILAGALLGPLVASLLVLLWAFVSGTPLSAIGLKPCRHWLATLAGGAALGIALKLALKVVVMPLLGAPATNVRYAYLIGNQSALPGILLAVLISASIGEEIFFRGYLFERMSALAGRTQGALTATVLITAAFFGLAHYADQGLPGAEQGFLMGVAYGPVSRICCLPSIAVQRQVYLPGPGGA